MIYTLVKDRNGNEYAVKKEENGITYTIPFHPTNVDYQAYLKWLNEGNKPEPADPLPEPTVSEPTVAELQAQLKTIQAQLAKLAKG